MNLIQALSRRSFLRDMSLAAVTAVTVPPAIGSNEAARSDGKDIPPDSIKVELPPLHAESEAPSVIPGPFLSAQDRVGFAVVGLGALALEEILPAFSQSKYARPMALVSGDRGKALKVATQYGIPDENITDYAQYERLGKMAGVDAIYIVLPNSMHREFVERGAKIGKHILCEKPMATSVADCEAMIAACSSAKVKLMIAYRQQYDVMNRELGKMLRDNAFGKPHVMIATNSQNQGNPNQWRQKKTMAGGGSLPDVGLYCLNAARFLSGEEPIEVTAVLDQPKQDSRFTEVEAVASFTLKFPSGLIALCNSAYNVHRSAMMRWECDDAFAEMSPAFGYRGSKLKYSTLTGKGNQRKDTLFEPAIYEKNQFALEMDHFADCIRNNKMPHTPGEEGLADQRIIEAIYQAAATGTSVKLTPSLHTRGPALTEDV